MPWRGITVSSTTRELAGYSPARSTLSLLNNGAANLAFSQDPANVAAQGFILAPGVTATLSRQDGDEPDAPVYGVSLGVDLDVRVQESVGPAVQDVRVQPAA